jgi:hypothetical protein
MTTTFSQTVLSPWLTPVRLVSIANIAGTYNNGPSNNGIGATLTIAASSLTIDSVLCAVGDRVLLQVQTNTYEQGIYIVKSIGSTVVLERADDQQCVEQIKIGQYVSVGAGSLRAGNMYSIVEPLPAILGINALVINADPSTAGVAFSGAASTANALPVFSDTAGNIKAATTTVTLGQDLAITGNLSATGTLTVTGNFSSPTTLNYAAVAITAAQFNGMYATPKLLVAAPGANKIIVLDKVDLLMTYVSANYAAGGVAAVQYDSTANGAGVIASTTLAAATFQAAVSTGFMFTTGVVPQTFTTCVNKGLYLSNITGAFTTGDSTFVAHVWYKIIPTV